MRNSLAYFADGFFSRSVKEVIHVVCSTPMRCANGIGIVGSYVEAGVTREYLIAIQGIRRGFGRGGWDNGTIAARAGCAR